MSILVLLGEKSHPSAESRLTKEPSEKMLRDAYLELSSLYHGDGGWIGGAASNEQAKLTYRHPPGPGGRLAAPTGTARRR